MSTGIYFHGTNGDNILSIVATGLLRPNAKNEIFFSRFRWESCLMHGADRKRKAAFVIKVSVEIPDQASQSLLSTPGVQDTLVLRTELPVATRVLELFVRRLQEDGAAIDQIQGETAIVRYLNI